MSEHKPRYRHNAAYTFSINNIVDPSAARELLIDLLRGGEVPASELASLIADMLDSKTDTFFKLTIDRRKAGKPQPPYEWGVYEDVYRCMDVLIKEGKKPSARAILDKGCEIIGLNTKDFSKISEKTISKYKKFVETCMKIELDPESDPNSPN